MTAPGGPRAGAGAPPAERAAGGPGRPDRTVARWQSAIEAACERILGRPLEPAERSFIGARAGLLALEAIHDHVTSLAGKPDELRRYLGSDGSVAPDPGSRRPTFRPSMEDAMRMLWYLLAVVLGAFGTLALLRTIEIVATRGGLPAGPLGAAVVGLGLAWLCLGRARSVRRAA